MRHEKWDKRHERGDRRRETRDQRLNQFTPLPYHHHPPFTSYPSPPWHDILVWHWIGICSRIVLEEIFFEIYSSVTHFLCRKFFPLKCGAVALNLSGAVPRWRWCDGAKILAKKQCSGAVAQRFKRWRMSRWRMSRWRMSRWRKLKKGAHTQHCPKVMLTLNVFWFFWVGVGEREKSRNYKK